MQYREKNSGLEMTPASVKVWETCSMVGSSESSTEAVPSVRLTASISFTPTSR